MKNYRLFLVLTMAIMVLAACKSCSGKNEPASFEKSQLVGLWGYSTDNGTTYKVYMDIKENGTFDCFYSFTDDVTYYECERGEYTVRNSYLVMYRNILYRVFFYHSNVLRIASAYNNTYVGEWSLPIISVSEDRISIGYDGKESAALYRLSTRPAAWKSEFLEEEKDVTEQELIGKWDYPCRFTQDKLTFAWWTIASPENSGIGLRENHCIYASPFWGNWVADMLVTEGKMASDEGVTMATENCPWSISGKKLTLSNTKYTILTYDDSHNVIATRDVTPTPPITVDFTIYSYTDHFMIWYSATQNTYYVFTRHADASGAAPHQMPASTPAAPESILTGSGKIHSPLSNFK